MQARSAVLIFANSLACDLSRRGWGDRLSPMLAIPRLTSDSLGGAEIHLCTSKSVSQLTNDPIVHVQRGDTFAERFEHAIAQVASTGAGRIVIVGRDCPQLEAFDVREALAALDSHRLVLGPDHRGGCWLIAFHTADIDLLRGIVWQRNTDCNALIERFGATETLLLETKIDLDRVEDLSLLARAARIWRATIEAILDSFAPLTCFWGTPLIRQLRRLRRWQLPPPLACWFALRSFNW